MRRLAILLFFYIVLTFNVIGDTTTSDSSYIKVLAEEVTPEPVEPGQDLTVKVRLQNNGGRNAEDVKVSLNIEDPFILKSESSNFDEYNDLCAGCSKENTYYFIINSDAESGIYPLNFDITQGTDSSSKIEQKINIKVIGIPDIVFESNKLSEQIQPGDDFTAKLVFKNIGSGVAKNLKIVPNSDNFIKLGSGLAMIDEISPNEIKEFNIDFNVAESVVPNTYNIPIDISFSDETGTKYESTQNYGIKIYHGASLSIQNLKISSLGESNSYITEGEFIEALVRIENVGEGNSENVKVELTTDLDGDKVAYLGKIESSDDEPAVFVLKSGLSGEKKISVKISYDDDFGHHINEDSFNIKVYKNGKSYLGFLVGIIVISIISLFMYNRIKKMKK